MKMTMQQAHTFMMKGDMPMLKMFLTMRLRNFIRCLLKRTKLFLLKKWESTHIIPTNWEAIVAVAAPRIPQSSTKMKIGARMTLQPTVNIDEIMAFFG